MAAPGRTSLSQGYALPVGVVCFVLLTAWYAAAVPMNAIVAEPKIAAAGGSWLTRLSVSWSLDRPVVPAPHQVALEFYRSVAGVVPWSKRSLLYHAWITLSSTLIGFLLGSGLGILLAVSIVHSRLLSKSLMPWIIASQTVPIIAIAPMVIGVLGSLGITGLIPKSMISMYLCFFPVTIGMVKGLSSPEVMQIDLMRTYNASRLQTLWKLRFPAALPFLFTSLKVAVAIALMGAIVGELPTGAVAGLGARLLSGSYQGQTIQIWSALFAASFTALLLLWSVDIVGRLVDRRMGLRP